MLLVCAVTCLYGIAVQPASVAATSLPMSDSRMRVDYPLAAYCQDGSVWLFWWQGVAIKYSQMLLDSSPGLRQVGVEIGIFCRLVGPDGRDRLAPMRLVAPKTWSDAVFGLHPLHVYATADGGDRAVLLLLYITRPESPTGPERQATRVISIDPDGKTREGALDFPVEVGTSTNAGGKTDGRLYTCFDAARDLHLFSTSWDRIYYTKLHFGKGGIKTTVYRIFPFVNRRTPIPGDEYLRWAWDAWDRADIVLAGPETLLVAYTPDGWGSIDHWWNGYVPGETLAVYRIRLRDLSLIDSIRVPAAIVAGEHFGGVRLPRAVLQRTPGGYHFYLSRPKGTDSYLLGPDGRPVQGPRTNRSVAAFRDFPRDGSQFLLYRRFPDHPWELEWFGIGPSGQVYHDALTTQAMPGRIE
jgi:hypothetical protein